ncbi:hypothetical protein chiPu_0028963 [Chiloscyllium punctatum]|uniref:Uncharacterized protein n=1 Tax=Chiloscyllium punctatum TaxID=137246 RepID=A0A401TQZ9_CHIPU|nr:hypothetical protein [Chiloscyllium punctatum]
MAAPRARRAGIYQTWPPPRTKMAAALKSTGRVALRRAPHKDGLRRRTQWSLPLTWPPPLQSMEGAGCPAPRWPPPFKRTGTVAWSASPHQDGHRPIQSVEACGCPAPAWRPPWK